jgi:hypothetical protein
VDKKITGSWLIHHTNKLQGVYNQTGYEKTYVAGKAGILLSAISADEQLTINNPRLDVLATASNINTMLELPTLLNELEKQHLIDRTANGISVLGVAPRMVLEHTANLFASLQPKKNELASIALAERASISPVDVDEVSNELADTFKLRNDELDHFLTNVVDVGFVDAEDLGGGRKILFNGNLFRRETSQKLMSVLDSLKIEEQQKLTQLTENLKKNPCLIVDDVKTFLGENLFSKVAAIGLFDLSVVSNSKEEVGYLTLPSAFSKYSTSMVDDALDLAKAFLSSITYGMTKSSYARGKIELVEILLRELVRGEPVGPVNAIAEDYTVLEFKGVVEVKNGSKKGRYGPMLRLLKKEVGELALQAISQGDVSEHSLTSFPTAAVTTFSGPEHNREVIRKKQTKINPKATHDMLSILRTGKGL